MAYFSVDICTYVWLHVHMSMEVIGQYEESSSITLSLNLKFADSATLAGQQAPRIPSDGISATACPVGFFFLIDTRSNSGFVLTQQTLY